MNRAPHTIPHDYDFRGRRVTVVGLGRFGGGVGVTRWLCQQGAHVTVSDLAPAESLVASLQQIEGCPATLHLGGHKPEDFLDAELLIVSPAMPKDHELLRQAHEAGTPRTSEINLFIERCPAPIVGITGSVGKSTTTAMIGQILSQKFTTHVGGNIGKCLLEDLPTIEEDHLVVLELSSFQLEDLPIIRLSPHVVVVTNLVPNHLDRHGTMDEYAAAKRNILRYQTPDDVLILNRDDAATAPWAHQAPSQVTYFDPMPPEDERFALAVPGLHNQANAQAAWQAVRPFGISRDLAAAALHEFTGLSHRLQFVAEHDEIRYYNDSKCTTPAGAIVALEAFPLRNVVILLGGYDKAVPFEELGKALAQRAAGVVAFGQTRGAILAALEKHRTDHHTPPAVSATDLKEALPHARQLAQPGQVVLLSPACASYDQFTNYEQRGDAFVSAIMSGQL